MSLNITPLLGVLYYPTSKLPITTPKIAQRQSAAHLTVAKYELAEEVKNDSAKSRITNIWFFRASNTYLLTHLATGSC